MEHDRSGSPLGLRSGIFDRTAPDPPDHSRHTRFAQLYGEHWRAVLAFALRRSQRPEDAADLVAETFLVVWRRFDDVPSEEETRVWLYAVARRVLANQRRGERRRQHLAERLREDLATAVSAEEVIRPQPVAMQVLGRMEKMDREVLLLTGWEELEPAEIAKVLGLSSAAVRSRLHRARKRFKKELDAGSAELPLPVVVGMEEA